MHCVQCGSQMSLDAKFCEQCGAPIQNEVAPPSTPQVATPSFSSSETDYYYPQVRPWTRYLARMLDISLYYLLALIVRIFTDYPPRNFEHDSYLGYFLFVLFTWAFVEAFLLSTIGSTPGKWLLRTHLKPPTGKRPSYSAFLTRSIVVWSRGLGLGIPIINIIALIIAHRDLSRDGITPWDKEFGFTITHEPVGILRASTAILFYLVLTVLILIGNTVTA